MNKIILWLSVAAAALALVACGDSGTAAPAAATTTTITGSAVKGPVDGATVTIRNASTGAVLGTTTTTISGAYSITTTFVGDVLIEINGGSYIDEASGVTTTLATPMRTVLTTNGGSVVGMVTPLTTMAYTYSGSSTPTAAAFNTAATNLATQMGLPGINLVTTLPSVTGTTNAYGNALRALSQYMLTNSVQLNTLINQAMNTSTYATFNSAYSAAYTTATGQTITVSFNGSNLVTIGGTGAGGGTGTCGVAVTGTITVANAGTFPANYNYCIQGIATGSCTASNSSLNSSLNSAVAGSYSGVSFNLQTAYSSTCAGDAIVLQLI